MGRLDEIVLDAMGKGRFERAAPAGTVGKLGAEAARRLPRCRVVGNTEEVDAGLVAHQLGHALP